MKKVAIIGAGASGICAVKSCLDEGLEPVCFELTDHIGGLWYYQDTVHEDQGSVMKTTVINTSKEMMSYSDFPIPDTFPNFMHNTKVIEYFDMYADHFKVRQYIRFNTRVINIKPTSDFDNSGQWEIEFKSQNESDSKKERYDAVLLCSGHHASKHMPSFPGQEEFGGKRIHTHDYRDHRGYEDKRVVVIGIGNSGGDVAVELSKISKEVYLSTRRGSWVANRISDNGMPIDMQATRRSIMGIWNFLPRSIANSIAESKLNKRFNHADFGLKPEHRFDAQHPTVNDELPNRIACGTIVIKPDVKRFTKTGVVFEDGSVVENIDTIIYATGFKFGFPYVEHPGFDVKNNVPNLYKYMFSPDMKQPTISAIGFFQPLGAIMPIAELQIRWSIRVFKGLAKLPSKEEMCKDVERKASDMTERYVKSPRHTIQVDWIPFMDELASHVGCKPDIWTMMIEDPVLAYNVVFGPCTPYQFRLDGPGSWNGARKAILTQWQRVATPLQTRKVTGSDGYSYSTFLGFFILVAWFLRLFLSYIV